MKKIIFSTIFIYLVISLALYNLPEIFNHIIRHSNDCDSIAILTRNDSIKNRLQKNIDNLERIKNYKPIIAISFNNDLHLNKISFLDADEKIISYIDSLSIPYDNMDLSKTNSKALENLIWKFPMPSGLDSINSLEAANPIFKYCLLDSLDRNGDICINYNNSLDYKSILESIYSMYIYIADDSIPAIKLNDVGTINGVYFANNDSVISRYDLWWTELGEETEIEQTVYRRNRPYKVKKRVRLHETRVSSDPVVLAEHECVSADKFYRVSHSIDGNYNLSHRLKCHPDLKANSQIIDKFANRTIYVTSFSKHNIINLSTSSFNIFTPKEQWNISDTWRIILLGISIPFAVFAIFLLITIVVYLIYYQKGKDQTNLLGNDKYSLYSRSKNNMFDKIGSKLTSIKASIISEYLWFIVKNFVLFCWIIPLLLWLLDLLGLLLPLLQLFAYIFSPSQLIGMKVLCVKLSVLYAIFILLSPLLLYINIIILDWSVRLRMRYLEKTYFHSYNTCDNENPFGILSITKSTFTETEERYKTLAMSVHKAIEQYPKESERILNRTSEKSLYDLLFLYHEKAIKISQLPGKIELARKLDIKLAEKYPNGYAIWKFLHDAPLYDCLLSAEPTSQSYEKSLKMHDINIMAQLYIRHGFTITTIEGKETDRQSWKKDVAHISVTKEISKTSFDNCTGIGIMLGEKSDVHALDFDNLNACISEDIKAVINGKEQKGYLRTFLDEVLNMLGLPPDYPWIVFSGSYKGLHILFRCDELDKTLSITCCSFQEPGYYTGKQCNFERVELRWKCHLVLPPSLHLSVDAESGEHNRYVFANITVPLQAPSKVSIDGINKYLTNKCGKMIIQDNYHCVSTNLPLALVYKDLVYSHTSSGRFTSLTMDKGEYVEWLKKCNDDESLNTLGVYYCLGWGVECNLDIARNYFEEANNDASTFNLAMLISCGCLNGTIENIKMHLDRIDFDNSQILPAISNYKDMINSNVSKRFNLSSSFADEQLTVISIYGGRHLVLAPPGCGKTRVLAERVVTAVSNQVDVADMLCLTFTNRAAREMRDRISSRSEQEVLDNLFVGNVHHFCSYMLREHKVISQRTTIIDDEESTAILQNIVRQVTGKEKKDVDSYYNYQHYLYQIEHQHPEELIVRPECGDILLTLEYKKIAREYVSYKERYGLLDFEDLLLKGYDFIRDHQDEIKKYSWIQIDEVQDLNSLQLAIIDLVATDDACIVYLGDEQQAIYGFNGVKMATLESLKDRCAGHIHHFLGNYRSPQYLLNILNQYAEYNLHVSRELLPIAKGKDAQNTKEDGSLIMETCDLKEGMDLSDYCSYDMACDRAVSYQDGRTAILANSNREVDIISERLYRRGVEHFKISGSDFMWTKEVKLILSHFNIFIHPENIMSWARIFMGFKVMPTLEEAHAILLEANDSYLYANDLLSDKRRSQIKEFLRYYPDEFVIFDTETTGLDVNNDDIVEIAAIRIKEGCIIDELDIMLETTRNIPVELNGEPNPLIEEYPKREKVGRRSGLTDFMSWVGNVPVLAHNAKFDFQILDANLKRDCNIGDLSSRWPIVLDSLNIARAVEPEQKSYRLKDLLAAFNLAGKNSHLAIDDVKATKSLVDYCYKKASPIFVKQNEFFAENRDVIEMLRKQYSNLYSHTKALLSKKESERNVFVGEIVYVYDCLVNDEIIGKMEKMKYLTEFLERDFLQETSELTLRQILDKYMMELNTLREADLCDSKSLREKVGLFVSTVHRAKGLEFDNVVVTGVVDGIYPFWEATKILKESYIPKEREKAQRDIEESARKLYVALSRSKKRLCIQYPRNNTGFGKFGWFQHLAKPSPFISCISPMFDNIMN